MPLMWLPGIGDPGDDPIIDVPASYDDPAMSIQPELVQPSSPVLNPRKQPASKSYGSSNSADHRASSSPARAATNAPPANSRGSFPWWILVALLIVADGKKRR